MAAKIKAYWPDAALETTILADVCGVNRLCTMPNQTRTQPALPSDCFNEREVGTFQLFENQTLELVNYYVWQANSNATQGSATSADTSGFLYALELYFGHGETLLLSSGENSDAIGVISAESLVGTAQKLREMHGHALIQRIPANNSALWSEAMGQILLGVQLSRHESGLYSNDVLLLDFGSKRILVQLSMREGLELGEYVL